MYHRDIFCEQIYFSLYYDSTSSDLHCLDRRTGVRLATLSTILLDNLSCISKLTEHLLVEPCECNRALLTHSAYSYVIAATLVKNKLYRKRCKKKI